MNKYEAMVLVKPSLSEGERNSLFGVVNDTITKYGGKILQANVWLEKKRLTFRIKKSDEATYYLVSFNVEPKQIKEIREAYRINENILRVLISVLD